MKKRMLTALSLLLCAVFAFAAVSCGSGDKYKTDVKVETLSKNAEQVIKLNPASLEFTNMKELVLSTSDGLGDLLSDGLSDDYTVRYTGGHSYDIYGVFRFRSEEDAKKGLEYVKVYLKSMADDVTQRSYADDDYKLDESEAKAFGVYVAFAVLTQANRKAFFDRISSLLTEA